MQWRSNSSNARLTPTIVWKQKRTRIGSSVIASSRVLFAELRVLASRQLHVSSGRTTARESAWTAAYRPGDKTNLRKTLLVVTIRYAAILGAAHLNNVYLI